MNLVLLHLHASGTGDDDDDDDDDEMAVDHGFQPLQEMEDAFLAKLNEKNMGPSDYAAALLVEHSLNRQQILKIWRSLPLLGLWSRCG